MDEQIHGLSMRDCAEIMAKHTALTAQYGEPAFKPHFRSYLGRRGLDENRWAQAWNGWWTRMESDPSGQQHAKFASMQQQLMTEAHMADVPDASQDAKEGVTLDTYAKIMAKIAGGEDANALLAAHGLNMGQWQRAQQAWNSAMEADVNHHLTTQYGSLYAKYTPGFQANMEAQTAAIMAAEHAERAAGRPDEPEKEYTFADMLREMEDPTPATRWSAAHHVCNAWDVGDHDDPSLHAAAKRAYTLLIECVERHDQFTVSEAEAAAGDLKMFAAEGFLSPSEASDAKGALARCLARGQEHLANLRAAFAPIQDKAVPERVKMQSAIQDYTSLTEELGETLEEWDENYSAQAPVPRPSAISMESGRPTSVATQRAEEGGGFLDLLKKLPIIGPLLRMLGL